MSEDGFLRKISQPIDYLFFFTCQQAFIYEVRIIVLSLEDLNADIFSILHDIQGHYWNMAYSNTAKMPKESC